MRLILCLLFALHCPSVQAQQPFPGINITPNGGNAGKINLRDANNVNRVFLQNATLDASAAGKAYEFFGSSTTNGNFVFNPGNVSGQSSVYIISDPARTTSPSLIVTDSTSAGTSNGIRWNLRNGNGYLSIDSSGAGNPSYTALNNTGHEFTANRAFASAVSIINTGGTLGLTTETIMPLSGSTYDLGTSSFNWQNLYTTNARVIGLGSSGNQCVQADNDGDLFVTATGPCATNPLTTTGDMIYSSSGSTAARLPIGSTGNCLVVSGGLPTWASCGSGDPAWTSFTPSVSSGAGVVTTTTVAGAYVTTGKTVKIRIYWEGQISAGTTLLSFSSLPASFKTATVQTLATAYYDSANFLGGMSLGISTAVGVFPDAGANFPIASNFNVVLEGVYETN